MSDLVKRLKQFCRRPFINHPNWLNYTMSAIELCAESADEIERLTAENERLRAEIADFHTEPDPPEHEIIALGKLVVSEVTKLTPPNLTEADIDHK